MDAKKLHTIPGAARAANLHQPTLRFAIARGDVPVAEHTADGVPLVRLRDVERFAANRPRRGPKPKAV